MLAELQRRFSRAAKQYDQHAQLQWQVASQCAAKLSAAHQCVADVGIGTGFVARQLHSANIIGIDISQSMLAQAKQHAVIQAVQGDMNVLPLATASCDALISSLAIQWAEDIGACLSEWRRVVKPGGQLVFSTLMQGSLAQLHGCRAQMGLANNIFLSYDEIIAGLAAAGWHTIDTVQQRCDFYFDDVWTLAKSLSNIGAQTCADNNKAPVTRRYWQQLAQYYEHYRQVQGLPLSYEVLYVVAEN